MRVIKVNVEMCKLDQMLMVDLGHYLFYAYNGILQIKMQHATGEAYLSLDVFILFYRLARCLIAGSFILSLLYVTSNLGNLSCISLLFSGCV